MRNSKIIFMVIVVMLLAVSVLAQEGPKKARRGGIIGALESVLKDMEKERQDTPGEDEALAKIPDELKEKTDFIKEEGEREESASTTDAEGNTTTVYRTKNGVWVTKVTDKNGNLIREERKIQTPDGGKKVETIDHKTGKRIQEIYDRNGNLVSSLTIDEKKKTRRRAMYKDGIIIGAKTIDGDGNITRATYKDAKVEYSDTKDIEGKTTRTIDHEVKNGFDVVRVIDHKKGTTTKSIIAPDGSSIFRTEDNETGETLSEVGISADGKLFTYQTGSDADKAFKEAERISMTEYSSDKDFIGGEESDASQFRYKNQAELDRQNRLLEEQMRGGKAVSGGDIIVSSQFKEVTKSSRREGQEGESESDIEHITSSSEVRAVNPDGQYSVKSAGEPVSDEGYGKTPSEALSNALNSAAGTVITKIKSEFLGRMHSTQKTDGGKVTQWSSDEDRTSTLDASSFAVFKGYEVESVGVEDGQYVVKVKAQPGVTERKTERK